MSWHEKPHVEKTHESTCMVMGRDNVGTTDYTIEEHTRRSHSCLHLKLHCVAAILMLESIQHNNRCGGIFFACSHSYVRAAICHSGLTFLSWQVVIGLMVWYSSPSPIAHVAASKYGLSSCAIQ